MSYRLGSKQKAIRDAMLDGKELWNNAGQWKLDGDPVDHERCVMMYVRGFLMGATVETLLNGKWRQRYELTDKGKAAL